LYSFNSQEDASYIISSPLISLSINPNIISN
jgi:hypothetical protein